MLNDEAHHVANESATKVKKWKEFLLNPDYGFRYILGVSGTCYVGDDYFADVIYRYPLRQAMEERYVKTGGLRRRNAADRRPRREVAADLQSPRRRPTQAQASQHPAADASS